MEYKRFYTQHLPFYSMNFQEKRIFFLADRLLFGIALTYTASAEIFRLFKRRGQKPIE